MFAIIFTDFFVGCGLVYRKWRVNKPRSVSFGLTSCRLLAT